MLHTQKAMVLGGTLALRKTNGGKEGQSLEKCSRGCAGQEAAALTKHGRQQRVHREQRGKKPRGRHLETKGNLAGLVSVPRREGNCLSGIQMLRRNEAVWKLIQVP